MTQKRQNTVKKGERLLLNKHKRDIILKHIPLTNIEVIWWNIVVVCEKITQSTTNVSSHRDQSTLQYYDIMIASHYLNSHCRITFKISTHACQFSNVLR